MSETRSYEEALQRLQTALLKTDEDEELLHILEVREQVLSRFQPIFSQENLPDLGAHEFHSFLLLENNQHWSGLHRHSPKMTEEMDTLREALNILLYGDGEIDGRLSQATSMVTGMGRAVATAILLVVYPDRYGVWNSTSEGGLKLLNLWPDFERGASLGEQYVQINDVLQRLAGALEVDLWTLDILWWRLEEAGVGDEEEPGVVEGAPVSSPAFSLERHLQDFLWDNWDSTELGQEWEQYTEEGSPDAGYEFPCGVGRIDLLARHRTRSDWLVIELKRGQTGDATLGQVLRYMGWIQQNLAEPGETVKGLIIAHDVDERLQYALSVTTDVSLQRYEVQFNLHPVARLGEGAA
jgi:hypothetical protein